MKPTFRTEFDMCLRWCKSFNFLAEVTPLSYAPEKKFFHLGPGLEAEGEPKTLLAPALKGR